MNKANTSMKSSVFWNTWGNIFYLACLWLVGVILVRLTDNTVSGMYSIGMTISNITYSVAIYGMRNYQISDVDGKYRNGIYIYSRLITAIIGMLLCLVIVIASHYDLTTCIVIILYNVFRMSEAIFDVYSGIFQRVWRIDYIGKSLTIRGVLLIVSFTTTLLLTKNLILALAIMSLCVYMAIYIFDYRGVNRLTAGHCIVDNKEVFALLKECLPLAAYSIILSVNSSLPRYFLSLYQETKYVGIYNNISAPTLIVQTLAMQIFVPFITIFAEYYSKKDFKSFVALLKKCLVYTLAISVITLIAAAVLGEWGIAILYPNNTEILTASYLLLPLIMCTILTAFLWLISGVLTVTKSYMPLFLGSIFALVINIPVSIYCTKYWGMQGANIALFIVLAVQITIYLVTLIRKMRQTVQV